MKKFLFTAALLLSATSLFAEEQEKVYYFDDFEWLKPATDTYQNASGQWISDNVGENFSVSQYNPQLKTGIFPEDPKKTLDRFLAMDYMYFPEDATSVDFVGVAKNYIKVSIGSKQGGIGLPLIEEFGKGTEGVHFSFKWTPFAGKTNGVPTFDKTVLAVIVRNGNNEDLVKTISVDIPDGSDYKWINEDVDLCVNGSKITEDTRIIIRNADSQYPTATGNYRWLIDDVKLYTGGAGVAEINVDENAPEEYYNLQGVKVQNTDNGIYLRRKGSKVEKVVIK